MINEDEDETRRSTLKINFDDMVGYFRPGSEVKSESIDFKSEVSVV